MNPNHFPPPNLSLEEVARWAAAPHGPYPRGVGAAAGVRPIGWRALVRVRPFEKLKSGPPSLIQLVETGTWKAGDGPSVIMAAQVLELGERARAFLLKSLGELPVMVGVKRSDLLWLFDAETVGDEEADRYAFIGDARAILFGVDP